MTQGQEISCGAVVFTRRDGGIRYLIIQQKAGHHGFPKGHMEPGETERETALREIREEVGITPRLLEGFRETDRFPLPQKPGVMKTVVYFLGEYEEQRYTPQAAELIRADLVSFDKAMKLLEFESSRRILRRADEFLRSSEEG